MGLERMQQMNGRLCRCGRTHLHNVSSIICRKGALNELPALLRRNGVTKPFILCDATTVSVIGYCRRFELKCGYTYPLLLFSYL